MSFEREHNRVLPGVPDVESPLFEEILAKQDIDDETRRVARALHNDGFAVIEFPEPDFDAISQRIIEGLADRYKDPVRIQDAWRFNPDVRRIAAHSRVMELLRVIYGRRPIPFQSLNFRVGTQQEFHSDCYHFSCEPERFLCGVWVAFEDMDEDNGPLVYYPGSHRLPIFQNIHLGVSAAPVFNPYHHYPRFRELWDRLVEINEFTPRTLTVKKGMALIWTANLLHGGAPVRDPTRTRHSQVTHYYFEDCSYYAPLLSDVFPGQIYVKNIVNIATGAREPNRYCGRRIPNSLMRLNPLVAITWPPLNWLRHTAFSLFGKLRGFRK